MFWAVCLLQCGPIFWSWAHNYWFTLKFLCWKISFKTHPKIKTIKQGYFPSISFSSFSSPVTISSLRWSTLPKNWEFCYFPGTRWRSIFMGTRHSIFSLRRSTHKYAIRRHDWLRADSGYKTHCFGQDRALLRIVAAICFIYCDLGMWWRKFYLEFQPDRQDQLVLLYCAISGN